MKAALLAPAFLFAAAGADARFAPRVGAEYRLTSTATSERDAERNSFTLIRTVVFERQPGGGYLARVTIRSVHADGVEGAAAAFARAFGALQDRPVLIELDAGGRMIAVRDLDRTWTALRQGMITDDAAGERVAAMLDSLSPAERAAEIASGLVGMIAPADADRRAGKRSTSIPARAFGGGSGTIPATETMTTTHDRTTIDLVADGISPAGANIHLDRHRVVDRASALVLERREEVTTTVIVAGETHTSRSVQQHRLDPRVQ